jgi:phosphatidylserine/phosphatidylglycerophosphate/cardiolipin synthase-like enzyme
MKKNVGKAIVFSALSVLTLIFLIQKQSTSSNISVYFTETGALTNLVLEFMNSSDTFLYVSALDVSHPIVLSALKKLYEKGVDVRIVTEKPVIGIPSKIDASKGLHHVKFMVNDHGVIFGSANFSVSGLETGLNDLILFPKSYSERFKEFFLNLWEYGKIGTVKGFLISPVDNPEEKVLKAIQKARKRIYICMYAFTDENILASIKWKQSQGIDVKIVTDKWFLRSRISKYLRGNSKIISRTLLHHKFVIVDDELFTGSTNYTESGFHKNVEMIWYTKDRRIVKMYEQTFKALLNGSW